MFYRSLPETIIKTTASENGTVNSSYLSKQEKLDAIGGLNYMIRTDAERNDYDLKWKRDDLNTAEEIFNRVPLFLNFLSLRGYKKILFVGHFNAAHNVWYHPSKSNRIVHPLGQERWYQNHFVDMNIVSQFIPIVKMAYGYTNFDMHVVKPEEFRHRHMMHSLYKRYGCDIIPGGSQYKHGQEYVDITRPSDTLYDAVVFAGVPKVDGETEFTDATVRNAFSPYCKQGFDIVDIYYQEDDPTKFVGGNQVDVNPELVQIFANRGLWDNKFAGLSPLTRMTETEIMRRMLKVYEHEGYGIPEGTTSVI